MRVSGTGPYRCDSRRAPMSWDVARAVARRLTRYSEVLPGYAIPYLRAAIKLRDSVQLVRILADCVWLLELCGVEDPLLRALVARLFFVHTRNSSGSGRGV